MTGNSPHSVHIQTTKCLFMEDKCYVVKVIYTEIPARKDLLTTLVFV